jgi:hypothetical protein
MGSFIIGSSLAAISCKVWQKRDIQVPSGRATIGRTTIENQNTGVITMKLLHLAAVCGALFASSGAALAADLAVKAPPEMYPPARGELERLLSRIQWRLGMV